MLRLPETAILRELEDLAKNDSVVLSLTYGRVVSIKATSETENVSGTIKEII